MRDDMADSMEHAIRSLQWAADMEVSEDQKRLIMSAKADLERAVDELAEKNAKLDKLVEQTFYDKCERILDHWWSMLKHSDISDDGGYWLRECHQELLDAINGDD
jgi:hypothetical protein